MFRKNYSLVRLFTSGEAPNSRIALENLRRLQERAAKFVFDMEIVDVMKDPYTAFKNGTCLTPELQSFEPTDGSLIFGNLSNSEKLDFLFAENFK